MMNNGMQLIQKIQQFRSSYNGNPQKDIQQMMNSGRITQEQYNAAVKQANQVARFLGIPTP